MKTLTEHGELMLQTAFDDLAEWCYKEFKEAANLPYQRDTTRMDIELIPEKISSGED